MATTVDLEQVEEILVDALASVRRLDRTVIDDTTLGNKPREAQVNRELVNLVDTLILASALTKNQYWAGKGLMSYEL